MSSRPEISPSTQVERRADLLQQLDRAIRQQPTDVTLICALGGAALRAGMTAAASKALGMAVEVLHHFIRERDADSALDVEVAIYTSFVKAVEDEQHYERCFSRWREAMAELGRSFRAPAPVAADAASRRKAGFVLHNGAVLGHTEVLLRLLEFRDREAVEPRIYSLNGCAPDLGERAARLGVPVEVFPESSGRDGQLGLVARLQWLRERLARNGDATAIWLSIPVTATFAFAMRIAPVQIFSALRYHPVRLPEVDGYMTYGSWAEAERVFHGQRWVVCPVPLALGSAPAGGAAAGALRARFPERTLLGTLAREEKIASRPFLESVAEILRRHPDCGFLWTGRAEHPGIAAFLCEAGVAQRCHFVGWVDTPLYAAVLEIFLETFPLGCGITGYQAMGAGVPLVSYLDSNTVFGMQYWSEVLQKAGSAGDVTRAQLDEYPVLCARTPAEYVDIVSRLVADEAYRRDWKSREAGFYAGEIDGIARYSKRYFDTMRSMAAQAPSR